jgi:hypothetical protein
MTEAEHRKYVNERKAASAVWRIIHALGSLKLAIILLSSIALACAIATFVESGFSAKVAQAYIYHAPWFSAWLGVLIINLFAVTLTRWPWLPKHLGFVITHYGIITLLIGSMIGAKSGFEANVTLEKGKVVEQLIGRETVIYLQSLTDWAMRPFDPEATRPTESQPKEFTVPGSNYSVVINRFAPALEKANTIEPTKQPDAPPGVSLLLKSERLKRRVQVPLLLAAGNDKKDFFEMATIALVPDFVEEAKAEQAKVQWKETHMVIANAPGAPTFHVEEGRRSGFSPLIERNNGSPLLHIVDQDGGRVTYRVSEILGKRFETGGASVEVMDYWPDFVMKDGKPATQSDQVNNPAMLIRLSGTANVDDAAQKGLVLRLAAQGITSDQIAFQFVRDGNVEKSGELMKGQTTNTGWADWTVELMAASSNARLKAEWIERGPKELPREETVPGLLASLVNAEGVKGEPAWIGAGSHVFLSNGNQVVRTGFGQRLIPLDFKMTLEKFEVPRLPGTDKPANFIATVRFDDEKKNMSQSSTLRMNHPASFPGGLWGQVSGQTYKFSQAQWDPENLDETTLQVLYDPGWLLKWVGSTMICLGITIMFYLKPKRKPTTTQPKSTTESETGVLAPHS